MPKQSTTRDARWGDGTVLPRPQPDGSVRYQARWDDNGTRRAKTFDVEDDAWEHLRTIGKAKRTGRYASPSTLTVTDLIAEHLERAASRLTERTIYSYRKRATTMIEPQLGSKRVTEMRTVDVQRWIDGLTRSGYKPATIHPAIAVLMAACREAKALGVIDRNPAEGIRRPTIGRQTFQTWTEEEARRALAAVDGDELFCALYHVALATGMRPGELRALHWRDIEFGQSMLNVRYTVTKDANGSEQIVTRTKTGQNRAIALSEHLIARLRWHRARQAERRLSCAAWDDLDLVFDSGSGHWLYQSHWLREHRRICAASGVPVIRCHDIRHTSASLELAAGTHPKIVADRLGHSSIQITLDLYSHVSPDLQRAAADALAERLFGSTTTLVQEEAK